MSANNSDLFFTQAQKEDASHFSYPNATSPRFTLPLGPQHKKTALNFFSNRRQRLKMFVQSLFAGETLYFKENANLNLLKTSAGEQDAYAAVSHGTPGAYNKPSVLLFDRNSQPLSLTKVGTNKKTSALLRNEANWLEILAKKGTLTQQIPELIKTDNHDAFYLLTQSIHTGLITKNILTSAHISFLSKLQQNEFNSHQFSNSVMHMAMQQRIDNLQGKMSTIWVKRSESALNIIIKAFGEIEIPMVLAHRDFAHWNIKADDNGIFVFDWEYATNDYFPLYDIFHFIVMPLALADNMLPKNVPSTLEKVGKYGLSLSNGLEKIRQSKMQLLGYLLDVCLFYLESNNGYANDDKIVNAYGLLIDDICTSD